MCFKQFNKTKIIFAFLLTLFSCNTPEEKKISEKSGGTLRLAMSANTYTFSDQIFPPSINNDIEKSIASIFYTSLFRINPVSLEIEPAICNNWEIDNTGLVYILKLDSTAKFHRDICFGQTETRNVTAYDVKYTFHILANPNYGMMNFTNTVYNIKGAKQYFSMTDEQRDTSRIEGIQVIDPYTLKITLDKPSPYFIQHLAHPATAILPHEAVEKYGMNSTIGVGPFKFNSDSSEYKFGKCDLYFATNENGEQLPYLDSIKIKKVKDMDAIIELFANEDIGAILMISSNQIADVIKKIPSNINYEISETNNVPGQGEQYNIVRSYVKGLSTNKLNVFEFEETYLDYGQ